MPRLAEAQTAQAREAAALDRQVMAAHAERARAEGDASQAESQAAAAAARMETLRAALTVLQAQERADAARARQDAERAERQNRPVEAQAARQREAMLVRPAGLGSIASNAVPAGQFQSPVIGVVVKGWAEPTDGGPATGVSYYAPPAARVVSPCGGRVVFADTFRSYGRLLIVDCGGGYHVVMSGFDRLDVRLGQSIVAAEPVGVMPTWLPGSDGHRPALYVELRRDGQPINPAPWLKSSR
jgi:septal ring factor EnvC (AmiA/AmiB activator)